MVGNKNIYNILRYHTKFFSPLKYEHEGFIYLEPLSFNLIKHFILQKNSYAQFSDNPYIPNDNFAKRSPKIGN